MILSVGKDVHQFQNTYMMLMTNQPGAGAWIAQALNSTAEMVLEVSVTQNTSVKSPTLFGRLICFDMDCGMGCVIS